MSKLRYKSLFSIIDFYTNILTETSLESNLPLTSEFSVYSVDSSQIQRAGSFLQFAAHFHSGPAQSDHRVWISEQRPEKHNLHLRTDTVSTCRERMRDDLNVQNLLFKFH